MAGKTAGWAKPVGESPLQLRRLNIGPRLTLCFLLIVVVLLLANGVLIWQFHKARTQADRLSGVDQELITVLQAHTSLMSFYERLDLLAHSENTDELVREVDDLRNALLQDSRRTRNALSHLPSEVQPDPALLPTLWTIQGTLPSELEAITVLAKSRDWGAVRLRLANQIRPLEARSSALVANIDRKVGEQRAQALLNIGRAQRRILLIVPITGALTLLFAAFLGLVITRSITRPVRQLLEGSAALARGDFSHRVPAEGRDEFARLGDVFNNMIVRLRELYRELQRRESYLAEAQKLSQTGSFGWNPANGEIVWSEETYRIFALDRNAQPTVEFILLRTVPEDRHSLQQLVDRATGEGKNWDLEHRIAMPDGAVKHLRVVAYAMHDELTGATEYVGAVMDVTERKRAEEELQQLVDFVPQLISMQGPNGKVVHANRVAQEYTGLTLNEYRSVDVVGKVIHPDDAERMRAVLKRALSRSDPFEVEARLLGKDGAYRWFLFRYNPLMEQGRVRRWYASATEIESRRQKEERVRKENELLEERTRIAQELHDTLLQSFLGASMQLGAAMNTLPSNSGVKPKLDQILQLMEQGIEDGRNAIEGLRSSDSRTLDLVLALSGVPQELAVQPDVDFRVRVAGLQQPIRPVIQQEVYRIGREALVNAFCHSGAKRVEFELHYTASNLVMRVRDNGCGIDPQVLDAGREGHWGLQGMRERAQRLGAQLAFSSRQGAGTEVELVVPAATAYALDAAEQKRSGFVGLPASTPEEL